MKVENIKESSFKTVHEDKDISLYTLKNKNGLVAQVTNYGAIILSIYVPDRNGKFADIVQGYDNIADYLQGNGPYMGAVCGRCANRIAGGKFTLNDKEYTLAINNGPNHLHGGLKGFDKVVWHKVKYSTNQIQLDYFSKDGEEGYPGNLCVTVIYTLTDQDELRIDYSATTDKTTIINLTSHSYFNLAGEGSGDVLNQHLMINANFFTPIDKTSVPSGEIRKVKGTPMDFTVLRPIGQLIDANDEQLHFGTGYDHNWVLNHRYGSLGLAAITHEPVSGRGMEIYTTQPVLQLYTANWINGEKGKDGKRYDKRWAFCLECQHYPDSINNPHFPTIILEPQKEYHQTTIHRFFI
jgi:aldose 1-epimerase